MKNRRPLGFILGPAVLAWILIGGGLPQTSSAQTGSAPSPNTAMASGDANTQAASTLPPDIDPNSPLAQVVSLAQAGVEGSIILNYVNNSAGLFNLDADKIIYLNDLGVPTDVINAMMQHDQQLEQAGVSPAPSQTVDTTGTGSQPAEVTVNYFYSTLAPYGGWIDVAGYGWCWRPTVALYNAGWQPYCDNGHWIYTDHGWFWVSGYSWGWAAFHYGRWFHNPRYGWCWWPDTTWAPSWVCWRYNNDYCGWAPLPPHAIYQPGVGLVYNGHNVTAGFHFGLGVNAFTFVRTRDFCDREPWRHRIERRDVDDVYRHTEPFHRIDFDRHNGTAINPGIPVHNITTVTRQPIHPVAVRYQVGTPVPGNRHERFEHGQNTVVVSRPHFVGSPVLTVNHGGTPATGQGHAVFRGDNPAARPSDPARNDFQHSNVEHPATTVNQAPNRNMNRFDRTNPQTPQIRQPAVPHVGWPNSGIPDRSTVAPRQNVPPAPDQKLTPRNNSDDNRILSPRRQQFEQQSPRSIYRSPSQETQQHFIVPDRNRYSAPPESRQNQYRSGSTIQNAPRNDAQHFNRTESQQRPAETHPSAPPPSSSAQHYNNGNNQGQENRH